MQLRSYQTKAIEDLRHSFRKQGKKSPVLVMPTAAGKTVVFASISKALSNRSKNVLILVHRKELTNSIGMLISILLKNQSEVNSDINYETQGNNIQDREAS